MALCVGLIGLPNVGKSTTFNALTKSAQAMSENYPFCTIEPNKAVVAVPDMRLEVLRQLVKPQRVVPSTIEFVDIAGLVRGASKGEGLGNKFLSHIREASMLLHVVRCFDDENITHVENSVDPVRDAMTIQTELILADIEQLNKKIEKLTKEAKASKEAKEKLDLATGLLEYLNEGNLASGYDKDISGLNKELNLLSAKEMVYLANVDENGLSEDNSFVISLKEFAKDKEVIKVCSKLEGELASLDEVEAKELLSGIGVSQSSLDLAIRVCYSKLGLISFFTAGVKEVRSWTIKKGTKAPKAGSVIHKDFEKGFIKAEVISYDDFIANGSEAKCKEMGKMRLEGKDYIIADADIITFRFNV